MTLRIQRDDDGHLDDLFADEVASVHFERMGETSWWGVVRLTDGTEVDVNFGSTPSGYSTAHTETATRRAVRPQDALERGGA